MYNSDGHKWYNPGTAGTAAEVAAVVGGDSVIMGERTAAASGVGKNQNCFIQEGNKDEADDINRFDGVNSKEKYDEKHSKKYDDDDDDNDNDNKNDNNKKKKE